METLEYLDVKVVDACSSLAVTNPSIIIHQNVEELITPSWTINIKLLSIFLKLGTHGFERLSLLSLGKAIKLPFSTSPVTLSLRFDLAPAYREAKLLVSLSEKGQWGT